MCSQEAINFSTEHPHSNNYTTSRATSAAKPEPSLAKRPAPAEVRKPEPQKATNKLPPPKSHVTQPPTPAVPQKPTAVEKDVHKGIYTLLE